MTLETQVNVLESQVSSLDEALVNVSDRLDQLDDENTRVQNFGIAKLDDDAHLELMSYMGEKISGRLNTTANVNRPTGIQVYEPGKPTIISYYQRLISYTEELTIDKIYPTTYQNPTAANEGIGYSIGFAIDVDNTGNLAICSYARHICRVYDSDGSLLFTIGIPAAAGHVRDGKLYNPVRVMFLANGNIAILSYNGYGEDATNHGHISEYSGTDGSFIKTRLGFYGDGQSVIGSNIIYRPMGWDVDKEDPNLIWISEYGRARVLLVNLTTWLVEDIYYPPSGYSFSTSYSVASLTDGNFALASNAQRSILIIDRETKEVVDELDVFKAGASPDFRDIKELKEGYLIFSGWTSAGAYVMPISNTVEINYKQLELPDDAILIEDLQFPSYNSETQKLTRRIDDLDDIPNKLCIPYTREV